MSSSVAPTTQLRVLPWDHWHARRRLHAERVQHLTAEHLERRTRGERHPVWDFMFSYYPTTPGKLAHWHPGVGVGLEIGSSPGGANSGASASVEGEELPSFKDCYRVFSGETTAWALDARRFWRERGRTAEYIRRLLRATLEHPPTLSCFGLHEWAMVYRNEPRHPEPLRLGPEATNAVVERSKLKCTHYDAFRFFTPEAGPLNELRPTRDTQPALEQPGCLHATMDLYKWATKLGPLVPGELWLETFELACEVRQLDMEASPYDLRAWGFQPVAIETSQGRAEYVRRQRGIMERGQRLRRRLIDCVDTAEAASQGLS